MTPAEMKERGEIRLRSTLTRARDHERDGLRRDAQLTYSLDSLDEATRAPLVRAIRELGEENRRLSEILSRPSGPGPAIV